MRYVLLAALLMVAAGCQALGDRSSASRNDGKVGHKQAFASMMSSFNENDAKKSTDTTKKEAEKSPDPLKLTSHTTPDSTRAPAIAPEVLLVPKMVYIPYAAQAPTSPVRLTNATPLMSTADEPARVTAAVHHETAAPAKSTVDTNQVVLEICKKLNERIDNVERKLGERNAVGPATFVAPPTPAPVPAPLAAPNAALPVIQPINASGSLPAPPSLYRRPTSTSGDPLLPCEPCPVVPSSSTPTSAPSPLMMK